MAAETGTPQPHASSASTESPRLLDGCDLIIEAAVENLDLKHRIFAELDVVAPAHTILASNTSSLAITDMAAATRRPDKVLGLHFMQRSP